VIPARDGEKHGVGGQARLCFGRVEGVVATDTYSMG
jgi:hypothetical protein